METTNRRRRTAPTAVAAQPQPSTEPVAPQIVSLGYARVWTQPAPQPKTAAELAAAAEVQTQLVAERARVANLVAGISQGASPHLSAELRRSEAAANQLQERLAELQREPAPRASYVQAVCVVTRGAKVERLIPLNRPAGQREAMAAVERALQRLQLLKLDPVALADYLAAQQHPDPAQWGSIVTSGLAVEGPLSAYRLVIRDGAVMESLALGGAQTKAGAHGAFVHALRELRGAALHNDRLLFVAPPQRCA